jgi:two-component system, OmpR family, heavy metal sensor histidine kinase CusS
MFAKRPEPRSIASQLAFLFTLAAAFLFTCGLGAFYIIVVRHAFEEDNAVLADKILGLHATMKKGGGDLLADEIRGTGDGPWQIRLLDGAGHIVAQTPAMNDYLPADIFPAAKSMAWQFDPQNYRRGDKLFSVATTRADETGPPFILQIAQDRSSDEEFSREFGAILAALLALGIVASSVIGIAVTRRGLRPLTKLTQAAGRIGPSRLNERVVPAQWPRELQPLALAFDDMLARLEDSFTRLSQFSADLAHELRTPIANIRGEAEVALTRPRETAEYREVIESTVAECERLSGIVDNLLFLARAEAADRKAERTRFDGRAAIEKIANYYRTLAEERRISILCSGEGDILAEPLLFNRALSNLLDNSLRFTPDGGTISITIVRDSEGMEVSVSDTGTGIPSEHLPRVFDRLYRVDASRSSHGAGLGLALVQSIVHLHGGAATVTSEPGQGTKVTLCFPNESVSNEPAAPAAGASRVAL